MPVPIVSLLSTMYTGDVSNRGGSKTEHAGRVTLQVGHVLQVEICREGYGGFHFVS